MRLEPGFNADGELVELSLVDGEPTGVAGWVTTLDVTRFERLTLEHTPGTWLPPTAYLPCDWAPGRVPLALGKNDKARGETWLRPWSPTNTPLTTCSRCSVRRGKAFPH